MAALRGRDPNTLEGYMFTTHSEMNAILSMGYKVEVWKARRFMNSHGMKRKQLFRRELKNCVRQRQV